VFADNNLGAKIDFSVFEEKDIIKYLFAENIGIVFQAKDDAALESKSKQCRFLQNGNCYYRSDFRPGPSKLDIAKYRDIWFKTSFLLDQNNLKRNGASAF
jgi:phosphoribosylformylglycinamidine synthase